MITKKDFLLDIFLTVITGGLFNLWVQYRQMRDMNFLLQHKKYSYLFWIFMSVITFGIYHHYHEYKMTKDLIEISEYESSGFEPILAAVLSFFLLWFVIDSFQQYLMNSTIES